MSSPSSSAPLLEQHQLTLRDGAEVIVRPITPDDAVLEIEFVEGLSDRSRYQRFFYTLKKLPPKLLAQLVNLDFVNSVALVATTCIDNREQAVGVARYAASDEPGVCEFAVVVADNWQGLGLATALLRSLIHIAFSNGFERMTGDILSENDQMQTLARHLGFTIEFKEIGVVEATLDLQR